jgi:hypothetical protein
MQSCQSHRDRRTPHDHTRTDRQVERAPAIAPQDAWHCGSLKQFDGQ